MDIFIEAGSISLEVSEDGTNLLILNGKSFMLEPSIVEDVLEILNDPSDYVRNARGTGYYHLRFKGDSPKCCFFSIMSYTEYYLLLPRS